MYDLLASKEGMKSSHFLTQSNALDAFPMLKDNKLIGAIIYYDG